MGPARARARSLVTPPLLPRLRLCLSHAPETLHSRPLPPRAGAAKAGSDLGSGCKVPATAGRVGTIGAAASRETLLQPRLTRTPPRACTPSPICPPAHSLRILAERVLPTRSGLEGFANAPRCATVGSLERAESVLYPRPAAHPTAPDAPLLLSPPTFPTWSGPRKKGGGTSRRQGRSWACQRPQGRPFGDAPLR